MQQTININPNYAALVHYHLNKRFIILQGGTRSGKTYSTVEFLIDFCLKYLNANIRIAIVRKTRPSLKASVWKDFKTILQKKGIYSRKNENLTELTYSLYGNSFEFFSVDQEEKVRGLSRDILYINEANEIEYEIAEQLLLRTNRLTILDLNPSSETDWIVEKIEPRIATGEAVKLITNYTHNPHLTAGIIAEILHLQKTDAQAWKVFGLGKRANGVAQIFTNYRILGETERIESPIEPIYGIDFGYTSPSAIVKIQFFDRRIYCKVIAYKEQMSNLEIVEVLRTANVPRNAFVFADAEAADRIAELQYAFPNIRKSIKNVSAGIQFLKRFELVIDANGDGAKMLQEIKAYRWKKSNLGVFLDEPVKAFDHSLDALRYAAYSAAQEMPYMIQRASPHAFVLPKISGISSIR